MKITQTRNYSLFVHDAHNRPITEKDSPKLRLLTVSMKKYGFLPFPIIVRRVGDKLKVIDGQHRLTIAQQLSLPVFYVETEREDIVIADCAAAQASWSVFNYVASYAAQGNAHYKELLEFAGEHQFPVSVAASILYGEQAGNGNVNRAIKDGQFLIKDRIYARRVAGVVSAIREHAPFITSKNSINAISRFMRVQEFVEDQFVKRVKSNVHLLKNQPTTELFSTMYEEIYNFSSRSRLPLAFMAREAAAKRADLGAKNRKVAA